MELDSIVVGDCLDVMADFPNGSIDIVLTDPPFASGARRESAKSLRGAMGRAENASWFEGDNLTTNGLAMLIHLNAIQWTRILKPNHHALCFTDWRMYPTVSAAMETGGLRLVGCVIWDKVHFGMGHQFRNQHEFIVVASKGKPRPPARRDVGNVISVPRKRAECHPTEKPVELIEILLSVLSYEGETVADFFMGSGTTAVAALKLGRHFYGCDINPEYVDIANGRIEKARLEMAQLSFCLEQKEVTNES